MVEKAEALENEGKPEEAIKLYKEALELRPDDPVLKRKIDELSVSIYVNGVKQKLTRLPDKFFAVIKATGEFILEAYGKTELKKNISNKDLFPEPAPAGTGSQKLRIKEWKSKNFIIKLTQGEDGGQLEITYK